jgi:hypothetical protein
MDQRRGTFSVSAYKMIQVDVDPSCFRSSRCRSHKNEIGFVSLKNGKLLHVNDVTKTSPDRFTFNESTKLPYTPPFVSFNVF